MSLFNHGPEFAMQAQNLIDSKTAVATGTAGTLAAVAPTESYGDFLTSHGLFVLSYAEWIQVIGAIWVLCLIVDFGIRFVRRLKSGRFWVQ
jgi:hypothetical protein